MTTTGLDHPDPATMPLRDAALAGYTLRTQPWGLLVAGWVLTVVVAVAGHLDSEVESMLVAISSTIGVAAALADRAASFTETTPERRRVRRVRALWPGLVGSLVIWLAVTTAAAASLAAVPLPGRWDVLGWATISASQVAVGSIAARRSNREPGAGPAATVAAFLVAVLLVPRFHDWLYPVSRHGLRWSAIAVAAVAVTALAWRDAAAATVKALRER